LTITHQGLQKYLPYIQAHNEGKILDFPELPEFQMSIFDSLNSNINQLQKENEVPEGAVAIINVQGMLTRSGSWWDYGTEDIANTMEEAFNEDRISAVVLRTNCSGSTWGSIFPWKRVFAKKNKPVLGAVDTMAFSGGYFPLAYCDKIFAVDKMAEVGSIGVMSKRRDWSKYDQKYGITTVIVTPPESKWKNLPERKAEEGNNDLLISEELSPMAQHFQEVVRENRPIVNEEVEGTLEGRCFFADARKPSALDNNLIDGIKSFDEILAYAADYENRILIENV
jgi:ClpP class serine protease